MRIHRFSEREFPNATSSSAIISQDMGRISTKIQNDKRMLFVSIFFSSKYQILRKKICLWQSWPLLLSYLSCLMSYMSAVKAKQISVKDRNFLIFQFQFKKRPTTKRKKERDLVRFFSCYSRKKFIDNNMIEALDS